MRVETPRRALAERKKYHPGKRGVNPNLFLFRTLA
jgi:hypothetical protein